MCSVMILGVEKFQLPFFTGTKVVNVYGKEAFGSKPTSIQVSAD